MLDKIENIRSVLADAQYHDLPGAALAMAEFETINAAMIMLKDLESLINSAAQDEQEDGRNG